MNISSLFNALSGIRTAFARQSVSAHNIANLNTPGYKSQRINILSGPQGQGTQVFGLQLNTSIGVLVSSDGLGKVTINGEGYFGVDLGNGQIGFTRNGNFSIDSNGNLTTSRGHQIIPPINIPMDALSVNFEKDGTVSASLSGGSTLQLGQIELVKFPNDETLQPIGDNIFVATVRSGEPLVGTPGDEGFGFILSGFSERSNVDLAGEMVEQITAQRTFEANLEIIKTTDEMLGDVLDIKS